MLNVTYQEKPQQQPRSLGKDANAWPRDSDTVWRVIASDSADFLVGDLLLYMSSQYKGHAFINLRSKEIYSREIPDGYKVQVVQDFTLNSVTLYADNSARP